MPWRLQLVAGVWMESPCGSNVSGCGVNVVLVHFEGLSSLSLLAFAFSSSSSSSLAKSAVKGGRGREERRGAETRLRESKERRNCVKQGRVEQPVSQREGRQIRRASPWARQPRKKKISCFQSNKVVTTPKWSSPLSVRPVLRLHHIDLVDLIPKVCPSSSLPP